MKIILLTLAANAVSLACVFFAGYLLTHDKLGWGWFLFVAVICTGSASITSKKTK